MRPGYLLLALCCLRAGCLCAELCGWPKVLSHYKRHCVLTGMADHACGPTYFSSHDRRRLANTLSRTSDVRLFRRVQAVLRVAEGDPIRSVARSLRISGRSVQRWVEVYGCRRQPEDLLDARRSGRPRAAGKLDQAALAQVLAQDPRALGYRATTWTTPLLTAHLHRECGCPVSERTLRRRLQEGGWRWKRPRYVFGERDVAVGQKKGAFAA